jgi:pyruvate kinase
VHRRSRIVATLGPATDRAGVLEAICRAGIDVARFNLSHGTAAEHQQRAATLRAAAGACGRNIAILADLPGPKLRAVIDAPMTLVANQRVVLHGNGEAANQIGLTEPEILSAVKPGHRILLDDGRLQLQVESTGAEVVAIVTMGGLLAPNKGINLPDTELAIPALTERDIDALQVAAAIGADWLALSFVRDARAADELRDAAKSAGLNVPVLAKIERPEAVERIESIVAAFDGIMVARGDLGVEIPLEQVPVVQKRLIQAARLAGKPVVTATDMLDSMRNSPRPTRAEASDVANAIYDGTDAVMLSGETTIGNFPVDAVMCMDRIVRQAEADMVKWPRSKFAPTPDLDEDIAESICQLAESVQAEALIVPTLSGRTARNIARHRPRTDIISPVPREEIRRRLAIVWGVRTVPLADLPSGTDRCDAAVRAAFTANEVRAGQRVAVIAGHPVEGGPRLPTLRIVKVGAQGESTEP